MGLYRAEGQSAAWVVRLTASSRLPARAQPPAVAIKLSVCASVAGVMLFSFLGTTVNDKVHGPWVNGLALAIMSESTPCDGAQCSLLLCWQGVPYVPSVSLD